MNILNSEHVNTAVFYKEQKNVSNFMLAILVKLDKILCTLKHKN